MLCWNNPEYTLLDGIILTKDYNPSNLKSHVNHVHNATESPLFFSDVSTITNSVIPTNEKSQSSMLLFQQNPGIIATPQVALSYLYQFFNEANVAIQQTNNENLKTFIDYLLEYGAQLRIKKKECYFSRYKYMKQREDRYAKFILSMKELVSYSRNYYKTNLSKCIPFLCVSHDGWDSLDHDILGVSLHFIVPGHYNVINVAVGLKRIRSKKSVATSNAILVILERYVIYYTFLFYI